MDLFKIVGKLAIDGVDEATKHLKDVAGEGEKTGSKLGSFFSSVGKGAAAIGKATMVGLGAAATGITALGAMAVKSYADYEQLVGGVETLFGTRGAQSVEEYAQLVGKSVGDVEAEFGMLQQAQSTVMANAANAYKTAGLSANEYMETATSLAAALNQSSASQLDSAMLADQAITDMSDNANKMGTSMEMIQNAYNGFSKQNYTMLDNLKLGYGGTKEEMQRLLDDAGKLETAMGRKFDINNFADVTEAIHLMQVEMGMSGISYNEYKELVESGAMSQEEAFKLLGTTAKEANFTIAGSMNQLKGAWSNLMTGLADENANMDTLLNNLVESAEIALNNLIPRITQFMTGISSAVTKIVPILTNQLPTLIQEAVPPLIQAAVGLVDAVVAAAPQILNALMAALPTLIQGIITLVNGLLTALPQIINILISALPQIITQFCQALPQMIPALINGIVSIITTLCSMLPEIIQPIIDNLPTIIVSIVQALVENLPALIEGAIQLVMGIVTALPQIIQALVDALPTIISMLVQALLENLPALIMGFIQLVWGIVKALPQIWEALYIELPNALWNGIMDGLGKTFSKLGDWFGKTFSNAKEWAVNAWSDAKEKWNNIKEKCVEGFANLKEKFGQKFSEAKEAAQQKWADAKEKWNNIKEKCVDAFSNLKDKFGEKFNEAKSKALEKWNDAKTKFDDVKDKVVNAFSNLKDKVGTKFNEAKTNAVQKWNDIKSKFTDIKGKVTGAFNDLGSKLKTKFNDAKDKALSAFSNIASKVLSVGEDVVSGIWSGISGSLEWIKSKITGWVGNVTSFIKKLFGINSPSTVMRDEVGRYLAEGVAVGIEDNTKAATGAMKKLGEEVIKTAKSNIAKEKKDAKELNAEILNVAKDKLDTYKLYNTMTAEAEANFWDDIRKKFTEGSAERIEADKAYFDARNQIDEELISASEKRLDKYKTYNDMTLAEEVGFWDEIRQLCTEGTDARLNADKKYLDAKKNLDDQILKAEEELQKSLADIQQRETDRTVEILNTSSLFGEETTADGFIMRLHGQTIALENYQRNLEILENKIGGTSLFEGILAEGFDAQEQLTIINRMSESQLKAYVEAYEKQIEVAAKFAKDELADQTIKDTEDAYRTFVKSCSELGVEVTESVATMENGFVASFERIATAVTNLGNALKSNIVDMFTGKDADITSLTAMANSTSMMDSATTTTKTLQNGLAESKLQRLGDLMSTYFPQLIEALNVNVRLDTGILVGELAPAMDDALGRLASRKDRGR